MSRDEAVDEIVSELSEERARLIKSARSCDLQRINELYHRIAVMRYAKISSKDDLTTYVKELNHINIEGDDDEKRLAAIHLDQLKAAAKRIRRKP